MSKRRWYRSLYWRIALGLFAFLVLTLVAQGALFFWMLEQTAGSLPARSPRRVAALVASDIATALSSDPNIDLSAYVLEQYGHVYRSFVVVMRDGRVVANTPEIPDELRAAVDERSRTFGPLQGPPPRPAP